MKNLQVSRKTVKLLYSKFTIFLLLLVVIFIAQSVWGAFEQSRRAKEKEFQTVDKLNSLEIQYDELNADLENLKTTRGLERAIRRDFLMAKPGERVITLVDKDEEFSDYIQDDIMDKYSEEKGSFWYFWR